MPVEILDRHVIVNSPWVTSNLNFRFLSDSGLWLITTITHHSQFTPTILIRATRDILFYPMLRADSRIWLVNNREIWSRISRLTSSAWDIKTKERHWWRHNGDSDRRPLSLPLRYDLVTLCLYDDLGQINVIAGILKLRKRFRMSQILFEHGINSLPLVCFRGYGNLSTLSIAIRVVLRCCVWINSRIRVCKQGVTSNPLMSWW